MQASSKGRSEYCEITLELVREPIVQDPRGHD